MTGPRLYGLIAQKQAGKDSLGNFLVEKHGYENVKMVEPLRRALLTLDPIVDWDGGEPIRLSEVVEFQGWDTAKEDTPEVRRLMQVFGTEVARDQFGQDFWVNTARRVIQDILDDGVSVVVTDIRFPNEAQMIYDLGGELVKIERPGLPDQDGHASESAWRSIQPDRIFWNDADLQKVERYADHLATFGRIPSNV